MRGSSILVLLSFFLGTGPLAAGDQGERALDRIVHIEEGIIREIPSVPRLCDGMEAAKDRIDIGGCRLYCEEEGKGPPIVLVHGGPGSTHHHFHPHFSRAAAFARTIYYDQRGCGRSDYEPAGGYSLDQAVDDLDRLRKALGIEKWTVLGHSYGGLLAQCYATKYPDRLRGLVLVCARTGLNRRLLPTRQYDFLAERERKKIDEISRAAGLNEAQVVFNNFLNGDWKRQCYYRPSRDRIARIALYEWKHDAGFNATVSQTASAVDLEGAFEACPIPTLILEGKWDLTWGADKPEKLHRNHPGSRLSVFESSAHSPFEDEPQRFFEELKRFVEKLPEVSEKELAAWKESLGKRKEPPESFLNGLGWGRRSNAKIAAAYSADWLERIEDPVFLQKTGFALYDAKRYDEALSVFKQMEERARGDGYHAAIALIWQGHMLDLLSRREEAIAAYRKAAELGIGGRMQHSQYGLSYSPSRYARERIEKPFTRLENRDDG